MLDSSDLRIARTSTGYLIRVVGRGTAQQSPAFERVIDDMLQAGGSSIAVDLTTCVYLDSTFLGSLLKLQRHSGHGRSEPLIIVAPPETRERLFHMGRIDLVLQLVDTCEAPEGETVSVPMPEMTRQDFGRHVAEAHRALAALGGSESQAFEQIARQIEQELGDSP